ncbi:MAG: hypothetical protein AAF485_11765, partial [Chloroflexota bacterium]
MALRTRWLIFIPLFIVVGLTGLYWAPNTDAQTEIIIDSPLQPLLGWVMAEDGSLFVIDATHSIYHLEAKTVKPLAKSAPLIPAIGTPENRFSLALDGERLFIGGGTLTQTLVLQKDTFEPLASLGQSSSLAIDPGKSLFVVAKTPVANLSYEFIRDGVWVYDLKNLAQAPTNIREPTMSDTPVWVTVAPASRRLYIDMFNTPGTSPRNSRSISRYDLDTSTYLDSLYDNSYGFAFLSTPAVADQGDRLFAMTRYSNGQQQLLVFDKQAQLQETVASIAGQTITDDKGEWLYILHNQGLRVLRGDNLSIQT